MKRRRLLKMLSLLPFAGSLAAQGKTGRSKRQPETLESGQVWKGKCLASRPHPYFHNQLDVECYYIVIESEDDWGWSRLCEYSKEANGANGQICMFHNERIRKLTYVGHITDMK